MMEIVKMYRFEAMHFLPNHEGQCRNPHGHSYRVWFIMQGEVNIEKGQSDSGMVFDYGHLSETVMPVIKALDHTNLNESAVSLLGIVNTTAEELALGLFERLVKPLDIGGLAELVAVRVSETHSTWAEWRP